MSRLKDFLENNTEQALRELIELPVTELTGIPDYRNIKELEYFYDIYINVYALLKFDTFVLWLVEYDNEYKKFKWLTTYMLYGSILFMLLYPILVSNYWFYLTLPLLPLSALASGITKSPYKWIFWFIIVWLTLYALFSSNYLLFGMICPAALLVKSIQKAKYLYSNTIIKSAKRNELNFKFLFYIGLIRLENVITGVKYSINSSRKI